MPIYYICKACGNVLFTFERAGQDFWGVRSYAQIIRKFRGKCPRCGHKLESPDLKDIEIRPLRAPPEAWKRFAWR